ncbi:hypothetical protein [Megalodesulfovibrio paquesii]
MTTSTLRTGVRVWGRLEALVFLVLGGWGLQLFFSNEFWLFLHPRFEWLLATSAGVCVFFGMLLLLRPMPRPHWRGMISLLLTVTLGMIGQQGLRSGAATTEPLARAADEAPEVFTYDGRDYLPLNLAELFLLSENGNAATADPEARYAMQGMLLPDPAGMAPAVLLRLQIVCCLADAVGVGFRVEGGKLPPPDGRWVRLLGRLRPVTEEMARAAEKPAQFEGVFVTVVAPGHVFVVEEAQSIEAPAMPFIADMRMEPPFAY